MASKRAIDTYSALRDKFISNGNQVNGPHVLTEKAEYVLKRGRQLLAPVFERSHLDPKKSKHRELLLIMLALAVFTPKKRGRRRGQWGKSTVRQDELRTDIQQVHGFDYRKGRRPTREEVKKVYDTFKKKYSDTTPEAMYRMAIRGRRLFPEIHLKEYTGDWDWEEEIYAGRERLADEGWRPEN